MGLPMEKKSGLPVLLIIVISSAAGFFLFGPGWNLLLDLRLKTARPGVSYSEIKNLDEVSASFAAIAEDVAPAVVHIDVSRRVKVADPFMEELFRFYGRKFSPREMEERSLGTGVIVDSSKGYILTNNHVVRHAQTINVRLADGRIFEARLLGSDETSDLAVLNISASGLPKITLGDSDNVKAGHMVLAFGNPFGLDKTVTQGIVSAVGRHNVGINRVEDYIQTDAAINPGNSGGPLVNTRGEVIGINTAIVSKSGGYQGVGFAIPINTARRVMEVLVSGRQVKWAMIGVAIQDLSEKLADRFGVEPDSGALVNKVVAGSPAEKAGLKPGDIIQWLDNKRIHNAHELEYSVSKLSVGTKVEIKFLRNGVEDKVSVTLSER